MAAPPQAGGENLAGGQQGMAERLESASRVAGSELVEGLELDLEEIWARCELLVLPTS